MAVVGESGSGKSTLALSIMGLISQPSIVHAKLMTLMGTELSHLSKRQWRAIRGHTMSLVFQDPTTAFHPMVTLGKQLLETMRSGSRRERRKRALDMLEAVGLQEPLRIMKSYPDQLSGGMLQRTMIAMSVLNNPKILIADEPTTALDMSLQTSILRLFLELKARLNLGMLFISHDLSVVAQFADRVCVMYQGKFVESGTVQDVFARPRHPYTQHLLSMAPRLGEPLPSMKHVVER